MQNTMAPIPSYFNGEACDFWMVLFRIDDLRGTARFVGWFKRPIRWAAVGKPIVQNSRDDTDDQCTADGRPEAGHGKALHQIGGQFQEQRIQDDQKESQRKDDQGERQQQKDGTEQDVEDRQHEHGRQAGQKALGFEAGHGGHS